MGCFVSPESDVLAPCASLPVLNSLTVVFSFCTLVLLTQMASVEAWSAVMQSAQNAYEQETQPLLDSNKFIALFFLIFMVRVLECFGGG